MSESSLSQTTIWHNKNVSVKPTNPFEIKFVQFLFSMKWSDLMFMSL